MISRSGHVHAVAALSDRYVQTASMQEIGDTVKTALLNSQGITGTGQRVALIDTRFYPQSLGAALVQEECFCASGCCPGGLTRRSGPGSSLTTGIVPGPDHGTQTASVIAYAGGQGLAGNAGVVGVAAPTPQDVFTALEWLATRSDIGVVSLSIGEGVSTGGLAPSTCDSDPAAAPWLSRLSTLAGQGKVILAAAGNGGSFGTLVPACTSVTAAIGGS